MRYVHSNNVRLQLKGIAPNKHFEPGLVELFGTDVILHCKRHCHPGIRALAHPIFVPAK